MKRASLLLILLLSLAIIPTVKAESPGSWWVKSYGGRGYDEANAIVIADNGDIIVAGRTLSFGAGGYDVWVLRLDERGNVKWQKTYGSRYDDIAFAVAPTPNGDIIVAGCNYKWLDTGKMDLWVFRLDENGNVKWQKTYGGNEDDEARAVAIASNGDIIVAGITQSFGAGSKDVWVLRLDENGNVKWQKTYGGNEDDEANAIVIADNGDILVAGETHSFGAGGYDVWVLRLDENGNVKWQKIYWGNDWDEAHAVTLAPNLDLLVAGITWSFGAGNADAWILKLPPNSDLPGCEFCKDSEAKVRNTNVEASTSSALVGQSSATVATTTSEVQKTNAEVKTQWGPGTVKISSNPSGAKVYINGDYKGESPLTLELIPGIYTIKLTMEYYEDYTATITLSTGETKNINATLNPTYGYLNVDSSPLGAEVYIDGNYVGTTPLENYKLSPGEYEVKIKKDGYEEYSASVTISAGETTTVSASLTPIPQSSSTTSSTSTSSTASTTSTSSSTSTTQTSSPTSPQETSTASGTSSFNPLLIAGALVGLILLGGIVAKARSGKGKPSTPTRVAEKPTPKNPEPTTPTKTPEQEEEHAKTVPGFPSELLNDYEPLEFIGEGGFAKVFKVKRKKDGKIVAVKIPRIDEKTSKTFIKEVSTWLHLDHPNIVKLYDVDILPIPYLEIEYVEGINVDGKIVRDLGAYPKPVDEDTALKLIEGIAEGLKHAHSKGIFHRDLKPLNVLLKSDLTPKITDWGLAKIGTMSSGRSVIGYTPLYAAPEQLMPSKYGHTDHRTDIWQLGITFYELLTGKLPFEGYTYEEVFGKITDETYHFTPPSKVNPALAKYDSIFEKLLAKRKEDRYQSGEEFLKDLERLEEAEKRKEELEKEVEKLKETLSKSVQALKRSKTSEEIVKNKWLVVETLGRLALAYAELNRRADLLNTLYDLKFYTVRNVDELNKAISTVEALIKEGLPVSENFIERLKVLLHRIQRENEVA